jgi:hypothetical protein
MFRLFGGCLKKGYTTSRKIGERLVTLCQESDDLAYIATNLFGDVIGEPHAIIGSSDPRKKMSDDAILALVKV